MVINILFISDVGSLVVEYHCVSLAAILHRMRDRETRTSFSTCAAD